MAGRVELIHQSMFQVGSQSVFQPPAPSPSRRGEKPADLQADEIIRRRSAVLEKQRERRRGLLCPLPLATWGNTSCLWPSYLGEEAGKGIHKTVHCTGTPSSKAPCMLRKQSFLVWLYVFCLEIFLVALKTYALKIDLRVELGRPNKKEYGSWTKVL